MCGAGTQFRHGKGRQHLHTGAHSCGLKAAKRGLFRSKRKQFDRNIERAGVSTSRLRVVAGWFNETLPPPSLRSISFLRVDGDLYGSTLDSLRRLYPLVEAGGAIYIDDYGGFIGCQHAVDQYRQEIGATQPLRLVWEMRTAAAPGVTGDRSYEAVWWIK